MLACAAVANAYELKPFQTRPTGSSADAVAVGDVNGDGRDDVVLTTTYYFDDANDYKLFVYLQDASGTLRAPIKIPYTCASETGIALADLDAVPGKEIIVGGLGIEISRWNPATKGFVTTWYGAGDDTPAPMDLAVLDVDLDGRVDIVGQTWSDGAVAYLGDGKGGIRRQVRFETPADGYNDAKAGDLNGDGRLDFVVTSGQGANRTYLYYNDGTPDLSGPRVLERSTGQWPFTAATAIGDFNGDGRDDLLVNRDQESLLLFPQSVSGTLLSPTIVKAGDANVLQARDMDGDGHVDAVVQHAGGGLGILLQRSGKLSAEILYSGPYGTWFNTQGMAIGDIDADGCNDVAVANYNYGLVTYLGSGCAAKADLRTSLGLTKTSAALRVDNIDRGIARSTRVVLAASPSRGYLQIVTLPKGCRNLGPSMKALKIECALGELRRGATATVVVGFKIVGGGARGSLSSIAVATTTSTESALANNTARKSVSW